MEVWLKATDLDAIIGGGCSVVCLPVSLLAAAWNIPAVSYGCTSGRLSDKETYPTFFRTVGIAIEKASVLYEICNEFNWKRVGIITDNTDISLGTAQHLELLLKNAGEQSLCLNNYEKGHRSIMSLNFVMYIYYSSKCGHSI